MSRKAIITGASSGIGMSIAKSLANMDIEIILLGRNKKVLDEICKDIGVKATNFYIDFEDIESIKEVYDNIHNKHGKIDILINCAGIGEFGSIIDLEIESLRKTIDINLISTICLTKEVVKDMVMEKRGQIINIESIAAKKAFAYGTSYVTSKFGMAGFSEVLWEELKEFEIKVCSIRPGLVNTNFFDKINNVQDLSKALDPEDIADVVNMVVNQSETSNISEIVVRPIKKQAQNLFKEILDKKYKKILDKE